MAGCVPRLSLENNISGYVPLESEPLCSGRGREAHCSISALCSPFKSFGEVYVHQATEGKVGESQSGKGMR